MKKIRINKEGHEYACSNMIFSIVGIVSEEIKERLWAVNLALECAMFVNRVDGHFNLNYGKN